MWNPIPVHAQDIAAFNGIGVDIHYSNRRCRCQIIAKAHVRTCFYIFLSIILLSYSQCPSLRFHQHEYYFQFWKYLSIFSILLQHDSFIFCFVFPAFHLFSIFNDCFQYEPSISLRMSVSFLFSFVLLIFVILIF